ncbi:uncharacterized protein E0L32_007979 [Thyridium curvatum]|uniref:FAD-binding domain-containing protein n=1 Tax=Thyridium curvatum TaxID=1093900 RepID=A0A507B2I6_9PEZI|nr:uncharacterized protein E0L32_007979 [Thyridium curvatum]TPX11118.1 hypothetical protein E0L32_007979 [Thyridium curvatum]
MSHSTSSPRIAIVGGGPAGLTLGVLLHKRGVPFTIYEFRQKPTDEELSKPSGMLDLHEESGLAAIRQCDLWDQFLPLTKDCADSMRIIDKHDNVLHQDYGEAEYRPEISRHSLVSLLMSALPPDSIKWGWKLVCCSENQEGQVTLDFGPDKGTQIHDLVIGADGAWSKVRNLLTNVKPRYAGIQYLSLTIVDVTTKHPDIAQYLGDGTAFVLGDRHGVSAQRAAQNSSNLYVFVSSEQETSDWVGQTPTQIRDSLLEDNGPLSTWGSKMKEYLSRACEEEAARNPGPADVRPLYMFAVGHRWESKPNITLVGDAAHLMTPFAGEGVNLAMWDSLDLANAIITAHLKSAGDAATFRKVVAPILREFDEAMFARSEEKARGTDDNRKLIFSENGARGMADLMKSFQPPGDQQVAGA